MRDEMKKIEELKFSFSGIQLNNYDSLLVAKVTQDKLNELIRGYNALIGVSTTESEPTKDITESIADDLKGEKTREKTLEELIHADDDGIDM